jgi:hypothetical protein
MSEIVARTTLVRTPAGVLKIINPQSEAAASVPIHTVGDACGVPVPAAVTQLGEGTLTIMTRRNTLS